MQKTVLIALLACCCTSHAQDSSADYTQPWQSQAHEILKASISFRTAQSFGEVPAFAKFLATQFRAGGFDEDDVHLLPMVSNGEAVASLVVRYRGDDSSKKQPILFLAHMDVVDAPGQGWLTDPFTLVEKNGNFIGRGVLDDKAGTTLLTSTFLRLRHEGFVPTRDLVIAFTGDEESAMGTIQTLTTKHMDLINAEYAFVLDSGLGRLNDDFEPVADYVQVAEKTYATFELTARNAGGHSALPRADNAIYDLADAIKAIQAFKFPAMSNAGTRAFFAESANVMSGPTVDAMRRFANNPDDAEAIAILATVPALDSLIRTTCVPTMLSGGHVENALPQSATVTVNCRIFPGVEVGEIEATLRQVVNNADLEFKSLYESRSAPGTAPSPEVMSALRNVVAQQYPGIAVIPEMEPGATDAKHLRLAGIPSYGTLGLFMREQDNLSHTANESLPVHGFYSALEYWHLLIKELAGSN